MNHYIFECLTKDDSHDKDEFEKGFQYMSLYEYTANASDNVRQFDRQSYRCAVSILCLRLLFNHKKRIPVSLASKSKIL